MAGYDFTIIYRKGTLNPADGLSKRPDHKEFAEKRNQIVFPILLRKFQLWQARVNRSDLAKKPTIASITFAVFTRKAAAGIIFFAPFLPEDVKDASDTHTQRTKTGSDTASNFNKESL
jgi:hypothetical protein